MMRRCLMCLVVFLALASVALASTCAEVTKISSDSRTWKEIRIFVSKKTKSKKIKVRQIIQKSNWYVVEYESDDFEPVINVLQKTAKGYAEKAGWGGMPEEGDSITEYLSEHAVGVPLILMQCFSPKGEPFI